MSGTPPPVTGADTESEALPETVLVAVICEVPAATPVTTPDDETVATAVLELDHVIVRPVRMLPAASRSVAEACVASPAVIEEDPNETVTDATAGRLTVCVALPLTPSLV